MGVVQRRIDKKAAKVEREYWRGLAGILYPDEQCLDYVMVELNGSPCDGLIFLTERRIILAEWGFDRVARPVKETYFDCIHAAKQDEQNRRRMFFLYGPPDATRDQWTEASFVATRSYPMLLLDRWFDEFGEVWRKHHPER